MCLWLPFCAGGYCCYKTNKALDKAFASKEPQETTDSVLISEAKLAFKVCCLCRCDRWLLALLFFSFAHTLMNTMHSYPTLNNTSLAARKYQAFFLVNCSKSLSSTPSPPRPFFFLFKAKIQQERRRKQSSITRTNRSVRTKSSTPVISLLLHQAKGGGGLQ